jgi:predicted phage terminase large subunit-like protein
MADDLQSLLQTKITTKDFLKQLAEMREQLEASIEATSGGFDTSKDAVKERKKYHDDFLWFARTYFPHWIRGKKRNGVTLPVEPSELHKWIATEFPKIIRDEESHNLAMAAPRGEAKSTYLLIFVIWCIVRDLKKFMIYIMDVYEQSAMVVESVAIELEINPRLACDFPHATGKGRTWKQGEIVTNNNVKLLARGAGQRVRGLRFGAFRPDLALLDDIENDDNVRSPAQRDKLTDWVNSAVENLGEAGEKFDILYVGTMLHYDSTLARTQANPLWKAVTFSAIIEWPHNLALWDKWEEILHNDGMDAAQLFYTINKAEMLDGCVVSWPDKRPLYELMKIRVKVGHASFDKEYQNDPVASDANFKEFTFWVDQVDRWVMFGSIDPSLGKKNTGRDPSAILIGGLDRETMTLDVVVADIQRRLPTKIIQDVINLQISYQCVMWFCEAVQFQEFLRTQLIDAALKKGISMPCTGIIPHTDKDLRIASLQPFVEDGRIRFHPRHKTLMDQMKHWPSGDHDDGPDCLEQLHKNAIEYAGPNAVRTSGARRTAHIGNGYRIGA